MKYLVGLFFAISLIFVANPSFSDPPLPTPVGRVVWVNGTLKAVMPNNEQRVLQKTSLIYLHDTLETDDKTQAQIVFTDNSLMTFRPATKFYIDQYAFNPQQKGSVGKYVMRLIEGGFRTITGLIAKSNPTEYQVNTPVATIGVRGTDYTAVFNQGQMYVGYYSGTPCVNNGAGSICLSAKTPFTSVPNAQTAPIPLTQQPAVFKEKLPIVQAKIAPFAGAGGTGAGGETSTGTTTKPVKTNGVINSFCITQ